MVINIFIMTMKNENKPTVVYFHLLLLRENGQHSRRKHSDCTYSSGRPVAGLGVGSWAGLWNVIYISYNYCHYYYLN